MNVIWSGLIGALVAFAGVVLGNLLKAKWDRHSAKLQPKTTGRAEAYRDFVRYVLAKPASGAHAAGADPHLNDVVARLIVFGERQALDAAGNYLLTYRTLDDGQACRALAKVVAAMRESLLTNAGTRVEEMSERLIRHCAGIPQNDQVNGAPSPRTS